MPARHQLGLLLVILALDGCTSGPLREAAKTPPPAASARTVAGTPSEAHPAPRSPSQPPAQAASPGQPSPSPSVAPSTLVRPVDGCAGDALRVVHFVDRQPVPEYRVRIFRLINASNHACKVGFVPLLVTVDAEGAPSGYPLLDTSTQELTTLTPVPLAPGKSAEMTIIWNTICQGRELRFPFARALLGPARRVLVLPLTINACGGRTYSGPLVTIP